MIVIIRSVIMVILDLKIIVLVVIKRFVTFNAMLWVTCLPPTASSGFKNNA